MLIFLIKSFSVRITFLILLTLALKCSTFKVLEYTNYEDNLWHNNQKLQLHVTNKISNLNIPISKQQGLACANIEEALIPTINKLYPKLIVKKLKIAKKKFLYVNKQSCTYFMVISIWYSQDTLNLKKVKTIF